jgi:transposase
MAALRFCLRRKGPIHVIIEVGTAWHKITAITARIYDRRNGVDRHFAWQQSSGPHVRFGSLADICSAKAHVRFTPESGHLRLRLAYALCQ